jgi:hypothetical protein
VTTTPIFLCYSQTGFLHRAADLTLVPSAAISKDFETAQVISGWLIIICLYCFSCHDINDVCSSSSLFS